MHSIEPRKTDLLDPPRGEPEKIQHSGPCAKRKDWRLDLTRFCGPFMFTAAASLAILGLFASAASFAHTKAEIDRNADRALKQFYTLTPTNRELVGKAAGVLIFGHVTKGGVGVGGEYGEGVLRVQGQTVNYYSRASASIGLRWVEANPAVFV